jgi:D-methionine transport system permease protein
MGEYVKATLETLHMVFFSSFFALLMGMPLGLWLVTTQAGGIRENKAVYHVLDVVTNLLRSFPFIILMIVLFPVAKLLIGRSTGTTATIVPLSIASVPFVARIMEQSFNEVEKGIIEAAQAMGSTTWQIISKVLIPEAMPSIVQGVTISIISIIGYSAMAGAIGGGGLGDLAIRYGYHRNQGDILLVSVIILIVIVQLIQVGGNALSRAIDRR